MGILNFFQQQEADSMQPSGGKSWRSSYSATPAMSSRTIEP